MLVQSLFTFPLCVLVATPLLLAHLAGQGQPPEIALGKQGCYPGASPRDHSALCLTAGPALVLSQLVEDWLSGVTVTPLLVHQQKESTALRLCHIPGTVEGSPLSCRA